MKYHVMIAWKYGPVENYIHALERQNMEAVLVSDLSGNAADFDALVLPGGGDVNPERYGQENKGSAPWHDEEDSLQDEWLTRFAALKKPVLGICRGHQLVNVHFGGTLIQDLPDAEKHARDDGSSVDKYHDAEIVNADSWLQAIYQKEQLLVNSSHHQAAAKLGKGMICDMRASMDDVEEASHHSFLPIYTVQFHPERMHPDQEHPDLAEGDLIFAFFKEQIKAQK